MSGELAVLYSPLFLEHKPPSPHPERPERVEVALRALRESGVGLRVVEVPPAGEGDLNRVHDSQYVEMIKRHVEAGAAMVDGETYVSKGTMGAALAAAGAALAAAKLALKGVFAFALVRPPGHHAGRRGRAMGVPTQGFCIFNNSALAVARLLELGLRRVAVLDFDAHHGNGTQEIFYSDPRVLHIDLHEDPVTLYPGTGFPTQLGEGEGEGYKVNVVLPPGSSDDVYAMALEEVVVPLLEEFRLEALVISAGFDAFKGDGLTHMRATEWAFARVGGVHWELGVGRVAVVLEGGYSVGLERGLPAFVQSLTGEAPAAEMEMKSSPEPVQRLAREFINEVKSLLKQYWKI